MVIVPYVSAGGILFGAAPSDVKNRYGAATTETHNNDNELQLWYDGTVYTFDRAGGRFVEVGFGREVAGVIDGLPIRWSRDFLRELAARDGEPRQLGAVIIFNNLGISATGFDDEDFSSMAITAYSRNRWDSVIGAAKVYTYAP